ncbi:MAG: calcium-binding protein, partial [Beijerinckiaceae bacterium]
MAINRDYSGNSSAVQVNGSGDADTMIGTRFDDTFTGADGDDTIFGGDGDDDIRDVSLFGIWAYQSGNDDFNGGIGDDFIDGGIGHDDISGGGDNDHLIGGSGDDTINGDSGDDLIRAGSGADANNGGSGYDRMIFLASEFEQVGMSIVEQVNDGPMTIDLENGAVNTGFAAGDTYSGIEEFIFAISSVTYRGDNSSDTIRLLDGNNVIEGRGGADFIYGGTGIDTASYESSEAGVSINLNSSFSQSGGDAENDFLHDIENIIGSELDDFIVGDGVANKLEGRSGKDFLSGAGGDDTLEGGAGNDTLKGGDGRDTLKGGVDNDKLDGGAGIDTLDGGENDDTLDGGDGN